MWIVLGIIVILLLYIIIVRNILVNAENRVDEAFSTMDVYLKKRWDLIPNIVEVLKGYAKHEKEALTHVVKLRNTSYENMNVSEKMKNNEVLNTNLAKLMALKEAYPELKAQDNFIKLSDELRQVEDEIANSRKYYNGTVREYNNKIQMFPNNIVAKIFGYQTKNMFAIKTEERNNVSIGLEDEK